jgi:2-methylcitrate dehydratase PrpD
MDLLAELVKHVVGVKYEDLPEAVVKATKIQILDTLSAILAGTTASISGEIQALVNFITSTGGIKESSIIGFGGKVSAPDAAFVNGVLCMRRDYDDTQLWYAGGHPSRSIIPSAFAMAERQGNVSGKVFLTAVALAHDLECRIAAGGRGVTSWYMVSNFFGAAAAAGIILGLDEKKMRHCLALAYHQICGARLGNTADSGMLKGISNGFTAKAGILSALLADLGLGTNFDFLDPMRRGNFYDLFFHGAFVPSLVTMDLGRTYMGLTTSQKEYPCCHGLHVPIKAILGLLKEYNLKAGDVDRVNIWVNAADHELLALPEDKKRNPANLIETQFSLYWVISSAIVYGEVGMNNFSDTALRDPRIRDMIQKVHCQPKIEFSRDQMSSAAPRTAPAMVEVYTKSGKVHSKEVGADALIGGANHPATYEFVEQKFKDACGFSITPVDSHRQDRVIKMVENMEDVKDSGLVASLLANDVS